MAINTKLELRQNHSLVMTPQLQQAIKLLQLSNIELTTFVETELERNPLLERAESEEGSPTPGEPTADPPLNAAKDEEREEAAAASGETQATDGELFESDDFVDLETPSAAGSDAMDAEPQDVFPEADGFSPGAIKDSGWATLGQGQGAGGGEESNLEAYVAEQLTLRDHLTEQLMLAFADPARRLIGQHLIDMTDEAGYLLGDLDRSRRAARRADRSGRGGALRDAGLRAVRRVRPRPARMSDAAAEGAGPLRSGDGGRLSKICIFSPPRSRRAEARGACVRRGPLRHDRRDEAAQSKARAQVSAPVQASRSCPTCWCARLPDGSFHVELNSDTLPRVLVNAVLLRDRVQGDDPQGAQELSRRLPADRELAGQEPRPARAHHPQGGAGDRAPAGRAS